MKTIINKFRCIGITAFALAIGHVALAQMPGESTTTTTTTSAGTISEFDPQAIVVRTETSAAPVRYRYTKTTTYVDEAGNPVALETVKSGLPVKVFFDRDGNDLVARKVVVTRAVAAEPVAPAAVVEKRITTTTSAGTISGFDPQSIEVRTGASAEPVRYRYTKTTTYVDENGNPVSLQTVRSGLPVTIYYDRDAGGMVARKVIVRQAPAAVVPAPGTVIEHKKTTTTTTTEDR